MDALCSANPFRADFYDNPRRNHFLYEIPFLPTGHYSHQIPKGGILQQTIGPNILTIINYPLACFLPALKGSSVQPLLKETKLSCFYKKKVPLKKRKERKRKLFTQLNSLVNFNSVLGDIESGFPAFHRPETTLLKVINDLVRVADSSDRIVNAPLSQLRLF